MIALNSMGKRRVGDIIALFEKSGFEILCIRKVKRSSMGLGFPDIKTLVLENQLNDLDAMSYYKSHFSLKVLRKRLEHFRNNHVELVFDSGENIIDVNDLWEILREKIFMKGKKLPILFVLTDNGVKVDDFILDDEFCAVDGPQLPTRVMNIRLCPQESY